MSQRINVTLNDDFETTHPQAWGSRIIVSLRDGHTISIETHDALDAPELPLSQNRLIDKTEMLLRHAGLISPARLIDEILAMADGGPLPILPLEECLQTNLPKTS